MFIVLNLCCKVINIDIIMWNYFYSVYYVNKQLGNNCFMLYLYSLLFVWFIFYHNSKVHGISLLWKVIFTICNTISILIFCTTIKVTASSDLFIYAYFHNYISSCWTICLYLLPKDRFISDTLDTLDKKWRSTLYFFARKSVGKGSVPHMCWN